MKNLLLSVLFLTLGTASFAQKEAMSIDPSGTVKIHNQLEVNSRIKDQTGYVMPVGSIIMYSPSREKLNELFDDTGVGKKNSAVEGWAICNGKDGRPDLRGTFIVGAGATDSKSWDGYKFSDYKIGERGGEEKHQLTVAEMPQHTHKINKGDFGIHSRSFKGDDDSDKPFKTKADKSMDTDSAGGDQPHENRPPFYALLYIIKL